MIKIRRPVIKKVKWGVAGLGRYSENNFIPSIPYLTRSTLVSVFSHDEQRAKFISEKFSVPNYFSDYDEFLKSDITAVYISSKNSDHYEQVIKAANAGKNILCEKPIALTSKQAQEMVEVCKKRGVKFGINYVHRLHPLAVKAKEILDKQMLGKLISIVITFNIELPPGENFRYSKEKSGGGALRDLGTHVIDLMRYFGGEIIDITGNMDQIIYKSEVDDFASAIIKFQNGGYGYFNVSFNSRLAFNKIEIVGHSGALSIENLIGRKKHPPKLNILLEGDMRKSFRKRGNKLHFLLRSVQRSFLKDEQLAISGVDGLLNMKLMEELERKCLPFKS